MAGFNKVVSSYTEAMQGLEDGMTVIAGGFRPLWNSGRA